MKDTDKIYEVVTGQILLSKRLRFFELHDQVLLPILKDIGIKPILLLITEVGRYGRFLDIYEYKNLAEYEKLTDQLITHIKIEEYYQNIGECIEGSINVEIMRSLHYANKWKME